jgi:hypothetical protein
MTIRLATFNAENLFARFKFGEGIDPDDANKTGWTVDSTVFSPLSMTDKAITGAAIQELDADVVCLQEIENVDTLKHFRARSLGGRARCPGSRSSTSAPTSTCGIPTTRPANCSRATASRSDSSGPTPATC